MIEWILVSVTTLIGFLFWGEGAHAFGNRGHQIVCNMALVLLEQDTSVAAQNASKQIKQLVSNLPQRHKAKVNAHLQRSANAPITFGDTCIWADAVRNTETADQLDGDHENTESWHFINVQRTEKTVGKVQCIVGCVLVGLELHTQLVRDSKDLNRTLAFLYLAHWIGDVHQPLHVSFADDAGGNLLEVSGIECPNMHSLWDTCLITKQNQSNAQLVKDLIAGLPSNAEMQSWQSDPIEPWANESLAISLDPKTGYCQMVGGVCRSPGGTVALTNDYVVTNFPVVKLRMQKAAVRMAGILKELLSD